MRFFSQKSGFLFQALKLETFFSGLGIGQAAFYTILFITLMLTALVSFYCIGIGIVAILICRRLCKNEPMLIEFLFENLMQQDVYEG